MNVVDHLCKKYFDGSMAALARFVGVSNAVVWQWKDRNAIRQVHQRDILQESDRVGLGISAEDFFPERLVAAEAAQ